MGGPEVEAFLTHLAADRGPSTSSHRQALSALLFLYWKVLGQALPWMQDIGRPVPKRRLPVVLHPDELAAVLGQLQGVHLLLAQLLYGTGMRITEGLQLRVKDIDFAQRAINDDLHPRPQARRWRGAQPARRVVSAAAQPGSFNSSNGPRPLAAVMSPSTRAGSWPSQSHWKRQPQLPPSTPGTFMRCSEPSPSTSCSG